MGFVHNQEVIICLEDCLVLVELATSHFRATEVLHRSEIDIVGIWVLLGDFLQDFEGLSFQSGAVGISIEQLENLVEILEPALINNRAVC